MTAILTSEINVYKIWLIFALLLFLGFVLIARKKKVQLHLSRHQGLLFLIFFFILIHAIFFSESFDDSSMIVVGIAWLISAGLAANIISEHTLLINTDKILTFSGYAIILSSLTLGLFVGYSNLIEVGNFVGITDNANYLGLILSVFVFPVLFCKTFFKGPKSPRLFYLFMLLLTLLIIYLTRSRTAIITVAMAVIYFIAIIYRPSSSFGTRLWIKIVAIALLGLFIFWSTIDTFINKYDGQSLLSTREHLFELRIEAIQSRPYLGWGFRVNEFSMLDPFHQFNKGEKGNTILALIEELGIYFGSAFVLFLSFLYYRAIRTFNANKDTVSFGLILFSSAIHLQGETWLFNFLGIPGLLIWMLLYIGLSSKKYFPRHLGYSK